MPPAPRKKTRRLNLPDVPFIHRGDPAWVPWTSRVEAVRRRRAAATRPMGWCWRRKAQICRNLPRPRLSMRDTFLRRGRCRRAAAAGSPTGDGAISNPALRLPPPAWCGGGDEISSANRPPGCAMWGWAYSAEEPGAGREAPREASGRARAAGPGRSPADVEIGATDARPPVSGRSARDFQLNVATLVRPLPASRPSRSPLRSEARRYRTGRIGAACAAPWPICREMPAAPTTLRS